MKDIILMLIVGIVMMFGFNSYAQVVAIDKDHVRVTRTEDLTVNQIQMQCAAAQRQLSIIQNLVNTNCPLVNQAIQAEFVINNGSN